MDDLVQFYNDYRAPAQHLVAFLLAGAAWRWGGAPERWLNVAFLATMVLPIYVLQWFYPVFTFEDSAYVFRMTVDAVAVAIFIGIALRANRNYPLGIAGFQLVALGAYLVKVVVPEVSPLALAILIVGPSYCQLLMLLVGFVRHIRRERRFGPYRDWRVAPTAVGGVTA
ncbi:MAG: hypothetical protein NBV68_15250 [Erythrobacter sp.]|uniref:hypothetical protein n=1 Tax=Erythrobacter sp. TaxID=1042 RepID=UPI0025D98CB8|nr:hypothetical protein [Erythrobacter sp.]MCM0000733.1 hypothetical protein [Erythrobacter sp.]